MLFTTCKKEEEESNNNNSSLTIHQTTWEVTSFEETDGSYPTTTINIPCVDCGNINPISGLSSIRYTFEESNTTLYIRIVRDDNDVRYDTLSYEYIPVNNAITVDCLTNTFESEGFIDDDLVLNILEHTSTNLILQDNYISGSYTNTFTTYLSKVN